jgi:hypothetical protein
LATGAVIWSEPYPKKEDIMRRAVLMLSIFVALAGWVGLSGGANTAAQDATPVANHPFVGTWVVDTISASENDSPEIAVVTADGGVIGQGANRVAGGRWEAVDDRTAELTLATVFDNAEGAGYVVVRGPHTVDETGDAWTCECTFTLVGADGAVLDSGSAPASGRRLPLQGVDMIGQPMTEIPNWTSTMAASPTP